MNNAIVSRSLTLVDACLSAASTAQDLYIQAKPVASQCYRLVQSAAVHTYHYTQVAARLTYQALASKEAQAIYAATYQILSALTIALIAVARLAIASAENHLEQAQDPELPSTARTMLKVIKTVRTTYPRVTTWVATASPILVSYIQAYCRAASGLPVEVGT